MNAVLKADVTPRAYMACLAAYNGGRLHGAWINVTDPDTMAGDIFKMLKASPEPYAEEWAMHDYDGFGDLYLSEYESLERLCKLAELIRDHEELAPEMLNHFGGDIDAARQALEEEYQGCYTDLEDYADRFLEDTGGLAGVPDHIRQYIDTERMARDWELSGDIFTIRTGHGELHVFWNR